MIRVDALPFPIVVGSSVANDLATLVRDRGFARVVAVVDASAAAFAQAILRKVQPRPQRIAVAIRRRTLGAVEPVATALAHAAVDERSLVIAIGNRAACDVVGFAAATVRGGLPYVLIATSLDAMVDGAIGSRRVLDDARGAETIGVDAPPVAVFCAVDALDGISQRAAQRGLAALVRHGIIEGNDAFDSLETLAPHPLAKWPWENVIADSIAIKAMHLNDAAEHPASREVLELGRRFGRALAVASDGRVNGGAAEAIGIRAAGLLAMKTGRFDAGDHLRVLSLLALLRLPLHAPDIDVDALFAAVRTEGTGASGFVLPRSIGDVEAHVPVPTASIRAVAKRCLVLPGDREFR